MFKAYFGHTFEFLACPDTSHGIVRTTKNKGARIGIGCFGFKIVKIDVISEIFGIINERIFDDFAFVLFDIVEKAVVNRRVL